MNKKLLRIIVLLSISFLLALGSYLVFLALGFTECMAPGRKWGFFGTLFLLLSLLSFIIFVAWFVSEKKTLEIKRPGDPDDADVIL